MVTSNLAVRMSSDESIRRLYIGTQKLQQGRLSCENKHYMQNKMGLQRICNFDIPIRKKKRDSNFTCSVRSDKSDTSIQIDSEIQVVIDPGLEPKIYT